MYIIVPYLMVVHIDLFSDCSFLFHVYHRNNLTIEFSKQKKSQAAPRLMGLKRNNAYISSVNDNFVPIIFIYVYMGCKFNLIADGLNIFYYPSA